MHDAVLVLEDGKTFYGRAFGAKTEALGEVVFNTGMTGYREILTDPSSAGYIVMFTYPVIGNCGINLRDAESDRPQVRGLIVKEFSRIPSHYTAASGLDEYLKRHGIPGIAGIDTRALTRYIRENGALKGIITSAFSDIQAAVKRAAAQPGIDEQDLVKFASSTESYTFSTGVPHVAVLDFGVKLSLLQSLEQLGLCVEVFPADTSAETVLSSSPDGLVVSGGPGDPKAAGCAVDTVRKLIGRMPVFGVCLGHLVLASALGGDTYKLKFGHRGANYPVKDIASGRVHITLQNHGYAVDEKSLQGTGLEITHVNLNDGTVEGMCHRELPVLSVQYYPEMLPDNVDFNFKQFYKIMKGGGEVASE